MEKQEQIVSMFNKIAPKYDLANRVLSFGIDKIWRKNSCLLSLQHYGHEKINLIVDVACGTGDMMAFWENSCNTREIEFDSILGIDPSSGMVEVGRKKFPQFEFKISSATETGLENESADIVSISYGIRNVVEREKAFNEFFRILKNNGLLVILEFTRSESKSLISQIRDFYLTKILPSIGGFISNNKEAYAYLPNSIESFISAEEMINELQKAGFNLVEHKSFSFGVTSLLIVRKENI